MNHYLFIDQNLLLNTQNRRKLKMHMRNSQSTTIARPMASTSERTASRPTEKLIDFSLKMPEAQSVALVGAFNEWDLKRTPMRKDPRLGWNTTIWLPRGRYEYRFVVDGQRVSDSNARESVRNPFGSTNSVLVV
jgi:1,4-alpha-glucan branching enzyme